MPPNTNNQNTGSVNYNQVVTPVTPNSASSAANIIGYGAGGNAIYANQPITTQDLQPTQPLKLPTATIPTVPSSLSGTIQASVNTNKTELQRYLDEQQQLKDTTGKDLKTMMGEIMGTTNEIANAPSSVDRTAQNKAREEIDLYTNQIEQEQLANRRLIENLQKNNPQGAFGGALTDKIQNLERDSLSKQADLAIMQNAATRRFTTAKEIADQQVQLKLEPLKAKLDNLKFFYAENKEQFNKADDRLFQDKIKQEERVYQREEKTLQQIADIKFNAVKNGAPLSVIKRLSNAKTVDEALQFAGNYNTDPLDRAIKNAQLAKLQSENITLSNVDTKVLNTDQFKKAQAAKNLKDTLQKAIDAVKTYGNKEKISATGRGILDTLKVQLRSEISTALEQGVVVPGEAASFDAIAGQLNKSFLIRNKKTLASLNSLSSSMDSRLSTQKNALKNSYGVTDEQFNNLLGIENLNNIEQLDNSEFLSIPSSTNIMSNEEFFK